MRKIADLPKEQRKTCSNPDHDPPTMIVLEPGLYVHDFPGCGERQYITVPHKGTL